MAVAVTILSLDGSWVRFEIGAEDFWRVGLGGIGRC
jgi:hypothetical protein